MMPVLELDLPVIPPFNINRTGRTGDDY